MTFLHKTLCVTYVGLILQEDCLLLTAVLSQFHVCVCVSVCKVLLRMWGYKSYYMLTCEDMDFLWSPRLSLHELHH